MNIFFGIVIILILLLCFNKFGREKMISLMNRIGAPIGIILFYLTNKSIILPVLKILNVNNTNISNNASIRVAIDSAIVTLLINIMLEIFYSPVKININIDTEQNLKQVITYCKKAVHLKVIIEIDFGRKWIKKLYKKYGGLYLNIKNTVNTSIAVNKEDEYIGIIDCSNASKYIQVNLTEFSNSFATLDKLYIDLLVQSDKTTNWNDYISIELLMKNNILKLIGCQMQEKNIELVHREEIL